MVYEPILLVTLSITKGNTIALFNLESKSGATVVRDRLAYVGPTDESNIEMVLVVLGQGKFSVEI